MEEGIFDWQRGGTGIINATSQVDNLGWGNAPADQLHYGVMAYNHMATPNSPIGRCLVGKTSSRKGDLSTKPINTTVHGYSVYECGY